jgi:flagellar FliJ protein
MSALPTLLQHAEGERDQVLAALRRAEDDARRARSQADDLLAYRAEYRQRWAGRFAERGTAEIVGCYQSFVQRLDEALDQQQQRAAGADAACARQRDALRAAEIRVASVRKLIERRALELQRVLGRREQRQTDEAAQHLQTRWRPALGDTTT